MKLYATFGNHMHWVDMQWLWGYHVLPGSVRDMLRLCREAGVKGNVNFDGIGYEKLASEDPEAFAELREAVRSGTVEVVGASYGQPYGQFHGGESNVRQRIYGARTARRLFGVWPQTFWEEEFDCFPQLPQMLARCGFRYGSLFFQWTWHTPEIPFEESPVVRWESPDGSGLYAATRNRLNLHQWPEDMDLTFRELAETPPSAEGIPPLVLQWLELMPSPDWMCRSELILPKLEELLADARFDIEAVTLGGYLEKIAELSPAFDIPPRRYHPDETWHGLTLGKNGDRMRRHSHRIEGQILQAEALAATLGLFGRPYAQWDVYPTWELEEAWRELLQAQHHDNDECEGLCGRVGLASYERADALARRVFDLQANLVSNRLASEEGLFLYNPLPWSRTVQQARLGREVAIAEITVGAYGWASISRSDLRGPARETGRPDLPALSPDFPRIVRPVPPEPDMLDEEVQWCPSQIQGAHEFSVSAGLLDQAMQPGYGGAWMLPIEPTFPVARVFSDSPYHIDEIGTGSTGRRKYPEGDWMTSPQWFEDVSGAFLSLSLVDLVAEDGSGLLIAHDGSLQWFRNEGGVSAVLLTRDPWDEHEVETSVEARFLVLPHGPISHSERWRIAQEFRNPVQLHAKVGPPGDLPPRFATIELSGGLVATAFHREIEGFSGRGLDGYAGEGFGHPYVLRLVKLDGQGGEAEVRFPATVARAAKTSLLGKVDLWLDPDGGTIRVPFGPHEIITLYLDLLEGRKQTRDLDAKREVWATVHRT